MQAAGFVPPSRPGTAGPGTRRSTAGGPRREAVGLLSGIVPGRARSRRCARTGRGPGPDAPVAAECAPRYVLVRGRGLNALYCLSADARDPGTGAYGGLRYTVPRRPTRATTRLVPA